MRAFFFHTLKTNAWISKFCFSFIRSADVKKLKAVFYFIIKKSSTRSWIFQTDKYLFMRVGVIGVTKVKFVRFYSMCDMRECKSLKSERATQRRLSFLFQLNCDRTNLPCELVLLRVFNLTPSGLTGSIWRYGKRGEFCVVQKNFFYSFFAACHFLVYNETMVAQILQPVLLIPCVRASRLRAAIQIIKKVFFVYEIIQCIIRGWNWYPSLLCNNYICLFWTKEDTRFVVCELWDLFVL